jgi:hypothetical protein
VGRTLLGLLTLLLAPPACESLPKSNDLSGELVTFGRYEGTRAGRHRLATAPRIYGSRPTLLEQTSVVPCAKGERFGIEYRIRDSAGRSFRTQLDVTWTHPYVLEITDRIRGTHTEYKTWVHVRDGISTTQFSGWGFDHARDAVEGTWLIEVGYQGRVLLSRSFDVSGCNRGSSTGPQP